VAVYPRRLVIAIPHVVLTRDGGWNPSVLEHSLTDNQQWYDAVSVFPNAMEGSPFDAEGNNRNLHVFDLLITDSILDNHIIPDLPWLYQAHEHQIIKNQQDIAQLRPNFPWLPENVVKETFKNTTQYARMPDRISRGIGCPGVLTILSHKLVV
jgi:hypothetical protein